MNNENDAKLFEHLQAIPGLDVTTGLNNLSGNTNQYHRLLVQLDNIFWNDITLLVEVLNQRKVEHACSVIHAFKGAAGTLGLTTLYNRSITLETRLQSTGNRVDKEVLDLAQDLTSEMNRFHNVLLHPTL